MMKVGMKKLKDIGFGTVQFFLPYVWRFIFEDSRGEIEDFPGQPPERGFALRVGTRLITSIGPLIFAAWISIDGSDIAVSTQQFIEKPLSGSVNWYVCLFWMAVATWTRALYLRLVQEDNFEDRQRATLMRSLFHLPDLSILWNYKEYHRIVNENIKDKDFYIKGNGKVRIDKLAEDIRVVLAVIAEMAQVFAKSQDDSYGANVMLVLNNEDTKKVSSNVKDKIRFLGPSHGVDGLDGLLVLPEKLAVMDIDAENGGKRSYPIIALPVRYGPAELILPGAPSAVLDGDVSVHEDTRELADECEGFSAPVREEVRNYFSANGEGAGVRSFASVRLGGGEKPIGVVNIDTDGTHVLGGEDEYYRTFWALLRPLLDLIAPLVELYAEGYRTKVLSS